MRKKGIRDACCTADIYNHFQSLSTTFNYLKLHHLHNLHHRQYSPLVCLGLRWSALVCLGLPLSHHFPTLTPLSQFYTFKPLSYFDEAFILSHQFYTFTPLSHFHTVTPLSDFHTTFRLSHFQTVTLLNFHTTSTLSHQLTLFFAFIHFHPGGPLASLVCFRSL